MGLPKWAACGRAEGVFDRRLRFAMLHGGDEDPAEHPAARMPSQGRPRLKFHPLNHCPSAAMRRHMVVLAVLTGYLAVPFSPESITSWANPNRTSTTGACIIRLGGPAGEGGRARRCEADKA